MRPGPPVPTYSERLIRREQLWWRSRWPPREVLHRRQEVMTYRRHDDPADRWQCCRYWPRTLVNKWNGREFVARYSSRLPRLLWRGSVEEPVPLASLPSEFVIRSAWGAMRKGVLVVSGDRELLHGADVSPAALRSWLPRSPWWRRPERILIEELVRPVEGPLELPVELKCHMFAGHVALIDLTRREVTRIDGAHAIRSRRRCYTPDWGPLDDPMNTLVPLDVVREPPEALGEILELSATLGAAIGTYMRIDFFLGREGWVFNEFSSAQSRGQSHTPFCDELFGHWWADVCPGTV